MVKLEVGKTYVCADGSEVKITGYHPRYTNSYPFYSENMALYSEHGERYPAMQAPETNIVREKTTVSNKAETIHKLINDLPVCADGKEKVRALVQEITGTRLTARNGEIWRGAETGNIYIVADDCTVCLETGETFDREIETGTYLAASLKEYLANGGKL